MPFDQHPGALNPVTITDRDTHHTLSNTNKVVARADRLEPTNGIPPRDDVQQQDHNGSGERRSKYPDV